MNKKKDFMLQLNGINSDIWNFEEKKVQVAAEYDRKIAEMEKAQATLTQHLSSEEVAGDPQKFRETTNALEKITQNLEIAYSRWGEITAAIEAAEAKLPQMPQE